MEPMSLDIPVLSPKHRGIKHHKIYSSFIQSSLAFQACFRTLLLFSVLSKPTLAQGFKIALEAA